VKIKKCLNICPACESSLALHLLQLGAAIIILPSLCQKRVEDQNLLFARFPSMLEAPCQNLVITASGQNALNQRRILNMQKVADSAIKTNTTIIVGWQLALCVQPNLRGCNEIK
jgi:hypothetical protein